MKIGNESLRDIPSKEYLSECFIYDHKSGILTRKERPESHFRTPAIARKSNGRFAGQEAKANKGCAGYLVVSLDGISYPVHRVGWKIYYNEDPIFIDHINGNRTDNRIENLRNVSKGDNATNRAVQSNSSTGVHGVNFGKREQKYIVYIKKNKRRTYLGSSSDFFQACCIRKSAEITFDFHENHGRAHRPVYK